MPRQSDSHAISDDGVRVQGSVTVAELMARMSQPAPSRSAGITQGSEPRSTHNGERRSVRGGETHYRGDSEPRSGEGARRAAAEGAAAGSQSRPVEVVSAADVAAAAKLMEYPTPAASTDSGASVSGGQQQYFITAGMDSLGPVAAEELEREIAASRQHYMQAAAAPRQTLKNRIRTVFHTLTKRDESDDTRTGEERKHTVAEHILTLVQVLITVLAGALLFWVFGMLWGRPSLHLLTCGLALAVQVVMVVAARLLRRGEEFWVLIFTWVVAFFVTIGPIVLVPR